MTETTLATDIDPVVQLGDLLGRLSPRKVTLYEVACLRRVEHLLPADWAGLTAIDELERWADREVPRRALSALAEKVHQQTPDICNRFPNISGRYAVAAVARRLAHFREPTEGLESLPASVTELAAFAAAVADSPNKEIPLQRTWWARWLGAGHDQAYHEERHYQAGLLRDIGGRPSRPGGFRQSWRTTDVLALAATAYRGRAWDVLPVLADALADAGCDDAAVLGHLCDAGPHARGCWVVDLVLGLA